MCASKPPTPPHPPHRPQDKTAATDKYDYECSNGEGWVKDIKTPLWSPDNTDEACYSNDACDSGVCVVTNETDATLGTKVCVFYVFFFLVQHRMRLPADQ